MKGILMIFPYFFDFTNRLLSDWRYDAADGRTNCVIYGQKHQLNEMTFVLQKYKEWRSDEK